MKKQFFCGLAVLAIAIVAAFNVSLNAPKNNFSTISLANVEALAYGESGDTKYYEYHCGPRVGTQCITGVTGPECSGPKSCP